MKKHLLYYFYIFSSYLSWHQPTEQASISEFFVAEQVMRKT